MPRAWLHHIFPKGCKWGVLVLQAQCFFPSKMGILRWWLRERIPPWSVIWDSNRTPSSKGREWLILKPQHCFLVNSSHIITHPSWSTMSSTYGTHSGSMQTWTCALPGQWGSIRAWAGKAHWLPVGIEALPMVSVSVCTFCLLSHINQLLRFPTHCMAFVLAWFFWLLVLHLGNILTH